MKNKYTEEKRYLKVPKMCQAIWSASGKSFLELLGYKRTLKWGVYIPSRRHFLNEARCWVIIISNDIYSILLIPVNKYLHMNAESVGKGHSFGAGSILVSVCPPSIDQPSAWRAREAEQHRPKCNSGTHQLSPDNYLYLILARFKLICLHMRMYACIKQPKGCLVSIQTMTWQRGPWPRSQLPGYTLAAPKDLKHWPGPSKAKLSIETTSYTIRDWHVAEANLCK